MKTEDPIIAILASDLHWSHKPPIARSVEHNWYETQKGYMYQLERMRPDPMVPIIIAGDITHKYSEPPEFINFLIEHHPEVYAIPGQHDLPHHNYEDIHKSVFWTLVKVGRIRLLEANTPIITRTTDNTHTLIIHGFPYGFTIKPWKKKKRRHQTHLAVCHSYIWTQGYSYDGARKEDRLKRYLKSLRGYDAAVFGDNHKGFRWRGSIDILNCGTFMRRNSDEASYTPKVGRLHRSGKISLKRLDTSNDKMLDMREITKLSKALGLDMEDFANEVESLQTASADFGECLERFMAKIDVSKKIRTFLLKMLRKNND